MSFTPRTETCVAQQARHVQGRGRLNTNASGTRRTSSAALNTCATIAPARWGVGQQLHPHNQQQLAMAVCSMAALPEMPWGPSHAHGGTRVAPHRLIKIYEEENSLRFVFKFI